MATSKIKPIKEFIAAAISPQRFPQTGPIRQGQDTNSIKPSAGSHLEQDDQPKQNLAACVLIVSDDGKILAVSRKSDPTLFGMPGGSVDPGETPIVAAARELKEETGLDVENLNPIFSAFDGTTVCTTFVGKVTGHINTDEGGVIRWVDPQVLLNPDTSPFVKYNTKLLKKVGLI